MYSFPKAVITRDRVAYNHRVISPGSGGQKCKTKVPAGSSPPGLLRDSLSTPSPGFWCCQQPRARGCLTPISASVLTQSLFPWGSPLCPNFSPKSLVILGLRLTLTPYDPILLSYLILSTKTLFPNKVTLTDEGAHTSLGAHD